MPTANDSEIFAPSTWWVWLTFGSVGLLITIGVGALFGLSPSDVLLGRDIAIVLFIACDYTVIAVGLWLAFKTFSGKVT